jgi:threonine dehydratase
MVGLIEIKDAYGKIKDLINRTPVMTSRTMDSIVNASVFLKCENYQRGGAFKFRGACNFLTRLTKEEKERGVIAYSSGNHAQAVALATRMLGIKSKIVMPKNAPEVKIEATRGYGAEIILAGVHPEDRVKKAKELVGKHGYVLIPPFDDERIIAGAGTATLEFIEEIGRMDLLFCPIGGGGLISGNSIAAKELCPDVRVVGVEPETADDAYRGMRDNKLYPKVRTKTVADGLRTPLSELTFSIIKKNVDEIYLVSDREIIDAMKFLWERMKMVVEPSGAASVAALMKMSKERGFKGERIAAIISGGNVDLTDFFKIYDNKIEGAA